MGINAMWMGMIFCEDTAINRMADNKLPLSQFLAVSFPSAVRLTIEVANTSVMPERDIATAKAPKKA